MTLPTDFPKIYKALGLMSGTSLDGVDVALVETDGDGMVDALGFYYKPYPDELRSLIRACFGLRTPNDQTRAAEKALTDFHAVAVNEFLLREGLDKTDLDIIGFHGQTITHDPANGLTWQLGDGVALARQTGVPVVYDFRTNDVAHGGQGAPLIPVYHYARARSSNLKRPVAILNIGGVSNLTYIDGNEADLIAFDCGPGNALIDDVILKHTGDRFDKDAGWARQGKADRDVLDRWLAHDYFIRPVPKSLDRGAWDTKTISNIPLPDAAATLTAFTVEAIAKSRAHLPETPKEWYVTGGGRLNPAIMDGLRAALNVPVEPVDKLGWNGDALEAEGFAYLAVRSLLGLPLSFPKTTGVPSPCTGGKASRTGA